MFDQPTLLPPNLQKVEYDLEQLSKRLTELADPVQGLWDAALCPEHLLPYLAWAFSVEVWEASWPEAYRRQVLVDAVRVHRRKGTVGSVHRALSGIGFSTEISEWFENGGNPYTFQIDAYGEDVFAAGFDIDSALFNLITIVLINVKPERAHFDLRIGERFSTQTYLRAGVRQASQHHATIDAEPKGVVVESGPMLRVGARARVVSGETQDAEPRPATAAASAYMRSGARARAISNFFHDVQRGAAV